MRFTLTTIELRWLVAGLLFVAAGLFAIGVAMESSKDENHASQESGSEPRDESKEGAESDESHEDEEESLFGLDVESPVAVTAALLVSAVLAVAVALGWRPTPVLAVAAVVAVAFAVLDLREVVHQLDEDESGVAAVAVAVALLHLGAAAGAMLLIRRQSERV